MQRKKLYSGQMSSSARKCQQQKNSEVIITDLMFVCFLNYWEHEYYDFFSFHRGDGAWRLSSWRRGAMRPWPPLILFNLTIKNLAWIQQWFMIREFSLIEKTIQWILWIPLTFLKVILWNQEFQTGAKTDPVLPCESYFRCGFSRGGGGATGARAWKMLENYYTIQYKTNAWESHHYNNCMVYLNLTRVRYPVWCPGPFPPKALAAVVDCLSPASTCGN